MKKYILLSLLAVICQTVECKANTADSTLVEVMSEYACSAADAISYNYSDEYALWWNIYAAKLNNTRAQMNIGYYYYEQGDDEEAVKWWTSAANNNDAQACKALGDYYFRLYYNDKHELGDKAYKWYKKSGDIQPDLDNTVRMGDLYFRLAELSSDKPELAGIYAIQAYMAYSLVLLRWNDDAHSYYCRGVVGLIYYEPISKSMRYRMDDFLRTCMRDIYYAAQLGNERAIMFINENINLVQSLIY